MKSHILAKMFLVTATLVASSTAALAETCSTESFTGTCYTVSGTVATENVTSTLQMGNINLTASNNGTNVFSENGSLVGNITGTDGFGSTFLSHKTQFANGGSMVTKGDQAIFISPTLELLQELGDAPQEFPNPVRKSLADGTPCSFYIRETISDISKGSRFFSNVISANVIAEGYISYCPNENRNKFVLSGDFGVE